MDLRFMDFTVGLMGIILTWTVFTHTEIEFGIKTGCANGKVFLEKSDCFIIFTATFLCKDNEALFV